MKEFAAPLSYNEYFDNKPENTLTDFANMLCSSYEHPNKIFVSDNLTKSLHRDFCHKCDITLEQNPCLPKMDDTHHYLLSQFMFDMNM